MLVRSSRPPRFSPLSLIFLQTHPAGVVVFPSSFAVVTADVQKVLSGPLVLSLAGPNHPLRWLLSLLRPEVPSPSVYTWVSLPNTRLSRCRALAD